MLTRRLLLLFAVGCGLSAGNLYYAQPILPQIQRAFHSSAGAAALVVAAGQLAGRAVGQPLDRADDQAHHQVDEVIDDAGTRPGHAVTPLTWGG